MIIKSHNVYLLPQENCDISDVDSTFCSKPSDGPLTATSSSPCAMENTTFFIGNLPLNAKRDDIKRHVIDHVSDMEEDWIISISVTTVRKYGKLSCHGSVTVSYPAKSLIPKINGSLMKDCKIKVTLFDGLRKRRNSLLPPKPPSLSGPSTDTVKIQQCFSQVDLQEVQEINVIGMTTPPLTEEVPSDVLMDHFMKFSEHVVNCECFKCHSRPYFKIRLKFSTRDHAKTAIITMNGSMLLGKHKVKLQLEADKSRRHSLPTATNCDFYHSKHHHPRVASPSLPQKRKEISSFDHSSSLSEESEVLRTPPKRIPQSYSIKVTNIKPHITKKALTAHFTTAGKVVDCKIFSHPEVYGIVTFKLKNQAEKAVLTLNESVLQFQSTESVIAVSKISECLLYGSVLAEPSAAKQSVVGDTYSEQGGFSSYTSPRVEECKSEKSDSYLLHRDRNKHPIKSKSTKKKNTSEPCKLKHTKVIFELKYVIDQSTFDEYIQHKAHSIKKHPGTALQYEIVQLCPLQEGVKIEVLFSSQNQAKHVLKKVVQHDPNIIGYIADKHNPLSNGFEQKRAIIDFKNSIEVKTKYYASKYSSKIECLQEGLKVHNAKRPKKMTLELFEKLEPERKAIQQQITECEHQYREFKCFCDQISKKLNLLEVEALETNMNMIKTLRKSFGRECNRYQSALPVYAYREYITTTIIGNSVTVLVGETGSGKSTQLVQYLYDAGLGSTGIIACTQPRKVAAISLAKHVCMEMGVTLGHELGYKTGVRGKYSAQTKVLYMTDHTLLNECIADPTFSKYSCLIIDEAHERSLSTDLLLAFIKQCLASRYDLKVVITSATIDPDLFVRYFGGVCPVIQVPGRTYPVDVIYCNESCSPSDSPLERDYVQDAIEQACILHEREPDGDFIVFLTSAIDIERACQLISRKLGDSAIVLPLHGKLQPEEQQKVFKEYEKRKIVFSTNVAETSITIPGVKCIIDTGLAKEYCFDPKKNMNSLEVRLISKSSAEQRKGRAGRTSAGKCYRLYSRDVYSRMSNKSLPEILRVTLASTVLKLYEFGVKDVVGFNFVEEPNGETLKAAVENLVFLGAIKDGCLTDLGKKMAALPIDPHYSKILFDGIDRLIGLEAATAVTISTLAGGIFFRGGSDEVKSESDMKTIEFCHPAGDQITYLHTYYQWAIQKVSEQNKWCVTNFINAKSMRMVKETLNELKDILKQQFRIVLPNFYDMKKAEEILPKLYFNTFISHLSVYLGHERIGYFNERHPTHQFVIFPGCPLRKLNEVPKCLVYEKTLVTSQHFLLQVLPVQEEWIQDSILQGRLQHHPLDSYAYQHYKVLPLKICNVGPHILHALRRRQEELKLDEKWEVKPVFEYLHDRGEIVIFLQEHYHEAIRELYQKQIDTIKEELFVQVHECGVSQNNDIVRLIVGNGGLLKHVLMPDQYRTVMVKARDDDSSLVWPEMLIEMFSTYGRIEKYDHKMFKKEQKLFVTFYQPEAAMRSIQLKLPEGITIEPRMFKAKGGQQFSLQIEWNRRKRKEYAFVDFNNEENLTIAEHQLCFPRLTGGIGVDAIKYKKGRDDRSQLFATNVNVSLSVQHIKEHILSQLPMLNETDFEVHLGYEKSFETPKHKVDTLKQHLHEHILQYVDKDQYNLSMTHPQNQHRTFRARVVFNNLADGQKVLGGLQNVELDGEMLSVKSLLSSVVTYSRQLYTVISEPLNEVIKSIEDIHKSVKFDYEGNCKSVVRVRISSDDVNTFMTAKRLLEEAIGPLSMECSQTPILREFLRSRNCRQMLERVKSKTYTFIFADYHTSSIKFYGAKLDMQKAYEEVLQSLSVFEEGIQCYEISLKMKRPPGLMKHLISRFGPGLKDLRNKDGINSVYLNPSRQALTLFSSEKAFDDFSVLLNECSQILEQSSPNVKKGGVNHDHIECCVCYTDIKCSGDIFRLEYCGHSYCRECISMQVDSSALSFPVECAADQCSKPFVWKDFINLSQRIDFTIPSFISASLRSFAAANPNLVRYCPTPDCPVVYRVSSDHEKPFFCGECGVSTCTKCHDIYHESITCEQLKDSKEKDKELEQWMQKNRKCRKRCPKCDVPIEKNQGCNYIHCRQCSADICWVCLKYFDNSNDCYHHLHDEHKGLWDPQ